MTNVEKATAEQKPFFQLVNQSIKEWGGSWGLGGGVPGGGGSLGTYIFGARVGINHNLEALSSLGQEPRGGKWGARFWAHFLPSTHVFSVVVLP